MFRFPEICWEHNSIPGEWEDFLCLDILSSTPWCNTTINRVEFAHVTPNNWLGNSKYDFCWGWDSANKVIWNQYNEIETWFGWNIIVLEYIFKENIFYLHLADNISRAGLDFIYHEAKRTEKTGSYGTKCGCTLRKMYDLPCACLIAKKIKISTPIHLDEIYTN